jgi:ABC-type phosphate transport system substrate-binding protein
MHSHSIPKKETYMRNTLATVALAAIPALILGACNGGAAGGPTLGALPSSAAPANQHRIHHLDTGSQDLHAGGADFPGYAYNLAQQPVGYYYQTQATPGKGSLFYEATANGDVNGNIYYCLNSSGDGRHAFEDYDDSGFPPTGPCAPLGASATGFGGREDPLDFVGTSVALPSTECCGSSSPYYQHRDEGTVTWGQPFEFPQIGGLISYPYRPGDFTGVKAIKLSTWTYCAISNGTVSDWNDSAITADNGKSVTGGTSETITFYFRSDNSGTTYNFVNHLNTVCNQTWSAPYNQAPYETPSRSAAWTFGVNSTWPGPGSAGDPNPNFIGESGALGILAAVQSTAYSTGYLEGSYAAAADPKVGQVELQNGGSGKKAVFVSASDHTALANALASVTSKNITYGEGSDGNPLGSSTPWCQLYVPPSVFVSPPAKTYPIVAVSYLLFYGQNNGVHTSDKENLIKYLESSKANKIVNSLEYASLPASVVTAVLDALDGTGGGSGHGHPCVQ